MKIGSKMKVEAAPEAYQAGGRAEKSKWRELIAAAESLSVGECFVVEFDNANGRFTKEAHNAAQAVRSAIKGRKFSVRKLADGSKRALFERKG